MLRNATKSRTTESSSVGKLRREDWIDAAWEILGYGNVNEIKINVLAKNLGVTRGSFYWHFDSREQIIEALADRWFSLLGLRQSIEPRLSGIESAEKKLFSVFKIVIEVIKGGQSIALRLHAKQDIKLRRRIQKEDSLRLEHFKSLFIQLGAPEEQAFQLAKLYHAVVLSDYLRNGALSQKERLAAAEEMHATLLLFQAKSTSV